MARQNAFRKRGVYGRDLARELALLEQSVHDKFTNDDAVEYGPLDIIGRQSSLYNAKSWEVIRFDPSSAAGNVLLPDAADALANSSWIAVKNDSDSTNAITIASLGGLIDGQTQYLLQAPRGLQWFFSDGQNWHSAANGSSNASAAIGIGTAATPGVLRSLVGGAWLPAIHVGGFWTLADDGGGSFYWDATSTATDDVAFTIRPTSISASSPGRWRRIWHGAVFVDWFGPKGDGVIATGAGTDDTAAIQLAINFCMLNRHRLQFNPKKVYKCASYLDLSNALGVVLDGQGGFSTSSGARLLFSGAFSDTCIRCFSTVGVNVLGLVLDGNHVTRAATDYTYANAAARLASVHVTADLGKTAKDTDTGIVWRLYATPSSWLQAPLSILDTRHKNWGGVSDAGGGTATEGSDGTEFVIKDCIVAGHPTTYDLRQGIRLGDMLDCVVENCFIQTFVYGLTGYDHDYGRGYAICVTVNNTTFTNMQQGGQGVYQPYVQWLLESVNFEGKNNPLGGSQDLDGVLVDSSEGQSNISLINCISEDAGQGTAFSFFGTYAVAILGCQAYGPGANSKFLYMAGCTAVTSHSNYCNVVYDNFFEPTGSSSSGCLLGADWFGAIGTNIQGTNFRSCMSLSSDAASGGGLGGLMIGSGNVFTGSNSLMVGTNNTCNASAAAIGASNVANGAGSLVSGQAAVSTDNSERVLGGGTTNGVVGGTQLRENVLGKSCLVGTGTILMNASQAGTGITFVDSRFGYIKASVVSARPSSGIHTSYDIWCHIDKTGGVPTLIAQGIDATHGPSATGITPSFIIPTGTSNPAIQVSVASGMAGPIFSTASFRAAILPHS